MPTKPARSHLLPAASAALLAIALADCDGPMGGDKDDSGRDAGPDTTRTDTNNTCTNKPDTAPSNFRQGTFLTTDRPLDLGIEGNGFFILKGDSVNVYVRRPGRFERDDAGYLKLGGAWLQGFPLVSDSADYPVLPGSLPDAEYGPEDLADVRVDANDPAPARATTQAKLAGNLDARAEGKRSVLYTQRFLHHAEAADVLIELRDSSGTDLEIREGDVLTFSALNGPLNDGSTTKTTFTVSATTTLGDPNTAGTLLNALTTFLRSAGVGAGLGTTVDLIGAPSPNRGAIQFYGNTAAMRELRITSDRPQSAAKLAKALAIPAYIAPGSTLGSVLTPPLRVPAYPGDPLSECFGPDGGDLGLEAGDRISISGSIGGNPAPSSAVLVYAPGQGGTRWTNLLDSIAHVFDLEQLAVNGEPPSSSASMGSGAEGLPSGSVIIQGRTGTAFNILDVAIRSTDANSSRPSPNAFNTAMNMVTVRNASDSLLGETPLDLYDDAGKSHRMTIRFRSTGIAGERGWKAAFDGNEKILKGGSGTLAFDSKGLLSNFSFDSGATRLEFDPMNGAKRLSVGFEAGVTGYGSATTVASPGQDGFPKGKLTEFHIRDTGILDAEYDNGMARPLFRIPLAVFSDPSKLARVGIVFRETGKPEAKILSGSGAGRIVPGALEYVDKAELP